jgi:hypothetical protein
MASKFFLEETVTAYRYVMLILASFVDSCNLLDLQILTIIKRMGHLNQGRINKNILPYCKRQIIYKTANVHKIINNCNWTWKIEVILT